MSEGEGMRQYSSRNLPPFQSNSNGIAYPKSGPDVAVCVAPGDTVIARPPSWGEGQALEIKSGVEHIAQDGEGDSYPNQEFNTFYETGESLDASDPRAAFLIKFWADRGFPGIKVALARKTRPAIVVGVVDKSAFEENGASAKATFENHEGVSELSPDGLILESPDDNTVRWFITRKVFDKKYEGVVNS